MVEIYPGLFVGDDSDCERACSSGWAVVHAAKEPYHRQFLGYKTAGAPRMHPEYLVARRGNQLALNLVDGHDAAFINKGMIDAAVQFVNQSLPAGRVLIHCNRGESRSPTVAMLFLLSCTDALRKDSLKEAVADFRKLYPQYRPAPGMYGFLVANWKSYATPEV